MQNKETSEACYRHITALQIIDISNMQCVPSITMVLVVTCFASVQKPYKNIPISVGYCRRRVRGILR